MTGSAFIAIKACGDLRIATVCTCRCGSVRTLVFEGTTVTASRLLKIASCFLYVVSAIIINIGRGNKGQTLSAGVLSEN
jgi:hypothetical protein